MMKRLLVISYYWPPASGAGVQRVLKFCKYIRDFGYEPVVVTSETRDAFHRQDHTLCADVLCTRVHRIYNRLDPVGRLAARVARSRGSDSAQGVVHPRSRGFSTRMCGWADWVTRFLWSNCFIPDSKIGWYLPARRELDRILKQQSFDAIMTSCPPYTTHLLGLYAKRRYGLPWLADFRDPWVENVYYNTTYRLPPVVAINRLLETRVLRRSDAVETVGKRCAKLLQAKIPSKTVRVIHNGYDPKDFTPADPIRTRRFRLGYYGSMTEQQTPIRFLRALAGALATNKEFARDFILDVFGGTTAAARRLIESHIPDRNVAVRCHISHSALIDEYAKEQVFLLLINDVKGNSLIITGKLFEYLHAGWPILCIGPTAGDAADIITNSASGRTFEHSESRAPLDWLMSLYGKWKQKKLQRRQVSDDLYNRREQARTLAAILDDITASGPGSQRNVLANASGNLTSRLARGSVVPAILQRP